MVKNIVITLMIAASLSACATRPKEIIIQEVKVPVLTCPIPVSIDRPTLPIEFININTTDENVVKYYKQSVKILQVYSMQLEKALEVYK